MKDLLGELKGNFEDLIVGLMWTPYEYDALTLKNAMRVRNGNY